MSTQVEGVDRTFVLAPFLLPGARLMTMVHERLGRLMEQEFGMRLRLLEAPIALRPIIEVMLGTHRHTHDVGHQWLRQRMHQLASEL